MERQIRLLVGVVLLACILTAFVHIYRSTPVRLGIWQKFNIWTFTVALCFLIGTRVVDDWRDGHDKGGKNDH